MFCKFIIFLLLLYYTSAFKYSISYDCSILEKNVTINNYDYRKALGYWYELYRATNFEANDCNCSKIDYHLSRHRYIEIHKQCVVNNYVKNINGGKMELVNGYGEIKSINNQQNKYINIIKNKYNVFYVHEKNNKYDLMGLISCFNVPDGGEISTWILGRSKYSSTIMDIKNILDRMEYIGLEDQIYDLYEINHQTPICSGL